MAKHIYKVASPDLAKKGSNHYQEKYQQQVAYKDQKGINCKKYGYNTAYIVHN